MKVLHTADTHLGDLTGPTKDGQNLRRLDTLRCMEAIVASAQAEKPDLAIIAGDLFNRSRVWADTALEDVNDAVTHFIRPLCEASSAVVLLFGTENHDNPRAFELLAEPPYHHGTEGADVADHRRPRPDHGRPRL